MHIGKGKTRMIQAATTSQDSVVSGASTSARPSTRQNMQMQPPAVAHTYSARGATVRSPVHPPRPRPGQQSMQPAHRPACQTFSASVATVPTYVCRERKPQHVFFIGKHRVLRARHHHHPPIAAKRENNHGAAQSGRKQRSEGENKHTQSASVSTLPPLPLAVAAGHTGTGSAATQREELPTPLMGPNRTAQTLDGKK